MRQSSPILGVVPSLNDCPPAGLVFMGSEKLNSSGRLSPAKQEGIYQLLPFILNPDNIARFEPGKVLIGDRRQYPFQQSFVTCETIDEVASAISNMVTQGSGPWLAAVNALRLLTNKGKAGISSKNSQQSLLDHLGQAREVLVRTRPTNTAMKQRLDAIVLLAQEAVFNDDDVDLAVARGIEIMLGDIYDDYTLRARAMADQIEDGDGILTNCFGEAGFILSLAFAKRDGKDITVFSPETRPYFQGAKLTAPAIHEMGIKVNSVTDNMPAYFMAKQEIQKYVTAADLITVDGHVVNKIGTYQNAIAARAHGIPFYAFAWGRDNSKKVREDIVIEERDPAEVRIALGSATTIDVIRARYPAFDITPPEYVTGIVTVKGIVSPSELDDVPKW